MMIEPGKLLRIPTGLRRRAPTDWRPNQTATRRPVRRMVLLASLVSGLMGLTCHPALLAAGQNSNDGHHTIDEAAEVCSMIAGKLASVRLSECLQHQLLLTDGRSNNGTPIVIKEYPPLPPRQPRARILLLGGIHGDEYSSVSVVFKWMRILDQYHSGLFHWRFVPLLNPDGMLQRRSQRMNAHGVDLNRNFPSPDWHARSRDYWVNRTYKNKRRYPGPDPLSEPESRWLAEEIRRFQPDVILSVHAPHGIVDFDGADEPPRKLGQLYLHLLGTYPGSLGNYGSTQLGIPVVTIELEHAGIMPSATQINLIWRDLIRWLVRRFPQRQAELEERNG